MNEDVLQTMKLRYFKSLKYEVYLIHFSTFSLEHMRELFKINKTVTYIFRVAGMIHEKLVQIQNLKNQIL